MSLREEIIEKVQSVPAMPTSVTKLMIMLQDPDADVDEMIATLEYDPGLTANLLRLANSAALGTGAAISSLKEAVVRLGLRQVYQLAVTSAITPLVGKPIRGYDLPGTELLSHSIAVAIGAEHLAVAFHEPVPQHAFTAGLLHDLGKTVLATFLEVDAGPITALAFDEQMSFEEAERQVLGIDHAEVGAILLESWKFPEEIVDVVLCHHSPENITGDPFVVDLVHIADILSMEAGIGSGGVDGLNYRSSPVVAQRRKLKPLEKEAVLCKILSDLEKLNDALKSSA